MALETQDLMALKSMGHNEGMTPYEQVKLDYMASRHHTSGIGVAGLVLGTVGTAAAIGAWIFGGMQSNAKGKEAKEAAYAAKEIAAVQNNATQRQLDQLATLLGAERTERLQGQTTISQTITDTISGQQSGSQTSSQSQTSAIDTTVQNIMQQTLSDAITGKSSLNPQPVMIYSAPQPCACPGCGCNG